MMGFSCMKDVSNTLLASKADKIIIITVPDITHKKVSKPAKEIPDKEISVDHPIRCLAFIKLARSVFAHKTVSVRAI